MKISGSGKLSEGKIDENLQSSGSVRLQGDFECMGLRSSGSLRGAGNLTVHGDVKSSGSFRLAKHLRGDGNGRFSGSTTVVGAILIEGVLVNSGSLSVGLKVEAQGGIRFSGSSRIQRGVFSQNNIIIDGTTTINGDVQGYDVFIGHERRFTRKLFKQPYKISGSILAKDNAELIGTYVGGDVRGMNVIIGIGTEVSGTVYYVNNIEIHNKAKVSHGPIQIAANDL